MSNRYDDFDELDALILETKASVIAKLDAATDFDALLADIYAKGGGEAVEPPGSFDGLVAAPDPQEARSGVEAVCDHIDMIQAVLATAIRSEQKSPLMGAMYLTAASRSLRRLRDGLAGHRLSKTEAVRLTGNVGHNLREIDEVLQSQHGLSLEEALHGRIGELMELGGDITEQIRILHEKVVRLFDEAVAPAALVPVPQG